MPATFIQVWAGGVFVRNAWRQARHGTVSMDTLVAIGTLAAWGYSVVVTVAPELVMEAGIEPVTYFDSSAMIIGLILAGRWLEARARSQASGAVAALVGLQARTARLVRGDAEADVPVGTGRGRRPAARAARREGARRWGHHQRHVLRRRGDAHRASPCRSTRTVGDVVIGATINGSGTFLMRATHVGRDSVLGQIVRMVREAQGSKAPIQRIADRVTEWFVPLVIVLAALTFVAWLLLGPEPR